MTFLVRLHDATFGMFDRIDWILPLVARFLFAAILLLYFWRAGLTKLGDGLAGLFVLDLGAYAQILPKTMEAAGYDVSALGLWHHGVVYAGTYTEFLLPVLIVLGLLSRLAALGMIGFVAVQSLTDLYGHGGLSDAKVYGAWFDRFPDAIVMDQRVLWIFLLLVIVVKGSGPFSVDALFRRAQRKPHF